MFKFLSHSGTLKPNERKQIAVSFSPTLLEDQITKSYELAKLDNWQAVDTTECVSKYSELEAVVIPGDPRNMKVTFIEDIFKLETMI